EMPRGGGARRKLNGCHDMGKSFLDTFGSGKRRSQTKMRIRTARFRRDGQPVAVERRRCLTTRQQKVAEIDLPVGIVRVEPQRLAIARLGIRAVAKRQKSRAEIAVEDGGLR